MLSKSGWRPSPAVSYRGALLTHVATCAGSRRTGAVILAHSCRRFHQGLFSVTAPAAAITHRIIKGLKSARKEAVFSSSARAITSVLNRSSQSLVRSRCCSKQADNRSNAAQTRRGTRAWMKMLSATNLCTGSDSPPSMHVHGPVGSYLRSIREEMACKDKAQSYEPFGPSASSEMSYEFYVNAFGISINSAGWFSVLYTSSLSKLWPTISHQLSPSSRPLPDGPFEPSSWGC